MRRGRGYVGTQYFSLKFAVNLKNNLFKKKERKEKNQDRKVLHEQFYSSLILLSLGTHCILLLKKL